MKSESYVYIWLRENGTPFYVGKGSGYRAFTKSGHRIYPPPLDRILVQTFLTEQDAYDAEVFLIDFYGRMNNGTGPLRNLCAGGRGGPSAECRSAEHRAKLNAAIVKANQARRGRKMPIGWLEKMRAGFDNMPPASRERMRAGAAARGRANKGKPLSEAHKRKMGDSLRGKPLSLETRQKMSIGQRGRSAESLKRRGEGIAKANRNREWTIESRAKASLSARRRWA